jgi:hypothetical protein
VTLSKRLKHAHDYTGRISGLERDFGFRRDVGGGGGAQHLLFTRGEERVQVREQMLVAVAAPGVISVAGRLFILCGRKPVLEV